MRALPEAVHLYDGSVAAHLRTPASAYQDLFTTAFRAASLSERSDEPKGAGSPVRGVHWFTADFTLYGITNTANLTRTIVDPLLELVRGGIAGGLIAFVLGKIR